MLPLAIVGVYKNEYPCATLLKERINDVEITPILVAALCVSLFESYMYLLPDSEQIEFETYFKDAFNVMLTQRHKYTSTFDIEDEV